MAESLFGALAGAAPQNQAPAPSPAPAPTPAPGAAAPAASGTAAPAAGHPIGVVEKLAGKVMVTHPDGSRAPLKEGDPVYQGDELQTGGDGAVGVVLADKTTFSMGKDGRMVLDEMVYDPGTQSGSVAMSVMQGVFTFVSGQVAKTDPDAMAIQTPVGTIGIRGTQVGLQLDPSGKMSVVLMEERDGLVGEVVVANDSGVQVLNSAYHATQIGSFMAPPSAIFTMGMGDLLNLFGSSLGALPTNANPTANDYSDIFTRLGSAGEEHLAAEHVVEEMVVEARHEDDASKLANFETAAGGDQQPAPDFAPIHVSTTTSYLNTIDAVKPAEIPTPQNTFPVAEATPDDGTADTIADAAVESGIVYETIAGSAGIDVLRGGEGSDFLDGGAGSDILYSGDGDDSVDGGSGDDIIIGGTGGGNDIYEGGDDQDTVTYQSSTEGVVVDLAAGTATDVNARPAGDGGTGSYIDSDKLSEIENVVGSTRDDQITGDANANILVGSTGADTLKGGAGDDILIGGDSADLPGLDSVAAQNIAFHLNNDGLNPEMGETVEALFAGRADGDDVLDGGAGNDRMIGGAGDDQLAGGEGIDTAVLSGNRTDYQFSLDAATGKVTMHDIRGIDGTDALDGVENLAFADGTFSLTEVLDMAGAAIIGSEASDAITGTAGSDVIMGGAGDDTLKGGAGDDVIDGGAGIDTVVFSGNRSDYQITLDQTTGVLTVNDLRGIDGTDTLTNVEFLEFADGAITIAQAIDSEASAPEITVTAAAGAEDGWIDLDIGAALTDTDGSETLGAITIAGMPAGAVLSTGTPNTDGTWTLTVDQLAGLRLKPAADSSEDFQLTVTAAATESASGEQATASASFTVDVTGVADTPTVSVTTAVGDMDSAIPLNIAAALADTDGSEALSVTVAGLPSGAMLSAGTDNLDGTWTLSAADLNGLTITPPPGSIEDFNLTVTATSSEDGTFATSEPVSLTVSVSGEVIIGTIGGDDLVGGESNDIIFGGDGDDVIDGGAGDDTIDGGTGADTIDGGGGNDVIVGSTEGDLLTGGAGADTIYGNAGNDVIDGGAGDDFIDGGEGSDIIDGGAGRDTILGSAEADVLRGGAGDDVILAGGGDDVILGGAGDDVIDGGAGIDTVVFSGNRSDYQITLDQTTGVLTVNDLRGIDGTDTLTNVEFLEFADGAITIAQAIDSEASAPEITVTAAAGAEDGWIDLDIGAALTDTDGSETLGAITIAGLPAGAVLSAGTDNGDGIWTLTVDQLAGLRLKPAANSSEDFQLTVSATSTESASGEQATASASFTVDVTGVADKPTLTVGAVGGLEDVGIPLKIAAALADTDGSETLSITISGMPAGAKLNAGTDNHDGSWTLTTGELQGLTLTPPPDSSADFKLSVTATASEDGTSAVSSSNFMVLVSGVADKPTVTVSDVSGAEDGWIALDIQAALADTDGSETLGAIRVTGMPEGAVLSAGTKYTDGSWMVPADQVAGLQLKPAANSSEDFQLTVTATAIEADGGRASTVASFAVDVTGVADTPTLTIGHHGDTVTMANEGGATVAFHNTYGYYITDDNGVPVSGGIVWADAKGHVGEEVSVEGVDAGHLGFFIIPDGFAKNEGLADGMDVTFAQDASGKWAVIGPDGTPLQGEFANAFFSDPALNPDGKDHMVDSDLVGDQNWEDLLGLGDQDFNDVNVTTGIQAGADARGLEDTAIPLDIRAGLTDTDGSETLTVTIAGVPDGAELSAGTDNGDGTWTLSGDDLAGLTITPPADSNEDFTLQVIATATEADGDFASVVGSLTVDVVGVADQPMVSVHDVMGSEDRALPLDIATTFGDSLDGSETHGITISGLPEGASLSAGTDNHDGTWTLTPAQMEGLKLTPPANYNGSFDIKVVAAVTEDDGDMASADASFTVTIDGGADAPTLTVTPAAGLEDTAIPLDIAAALTDAGESLSITIAGLPEGASLSAGTDNGDGTWTLTADQLDGLAVTPPHDSNEDFELTVTATSTDGNDSASTLATLAVAVTGVADTPMVTVSDASAMVNTTVPLDLSAALSDLDGSEALSLTIGGLPAGSELSAGTDNGDGTWTLTAGQLDGLTVTPPAGSSADATLTLAVTTTENDGDTATVTRSLDVDLRPEAHDDVNVADFGSGRSVSGNVVSGAGDTANPAAAADAGSGLHVAEVSFGGNSASFADPADVHADDTGAYVEIEGQAGTLRMYADGSYVYTADEGAAATPGETLGAGLAGTGSPAQVQAAWNGVGLHAFDFGTSFTNAEGRFDPTLADDSVSYGPRGIGVAGSEDGMPVPDQINHDSATGESEALALDLGSLVTEARLTVSNMFTTESGGERAMWTAFDADGNKVGEGVLDASTVDYADNQVGTATIDAGAPFQYLVLSALPTPRPTPNDSSDFFIRAVEFDTLGTAVEEPVEEVFTYTMADVDGDLASATLTILNDPEADAPTLVVSDAAGLEDTAIPLDIAAALTDAGESLSIVVAGMPEGASLSAGTDNGDGTWTLTADQLSGLTVTPPHDSNVDFQLTVTATSSDGNDSASTSATIDVDVTGVADATGVAASDATAHLDVGTDDIIVGTAAGETLSGGAGDDSLRGEGGDDVLYGDGANPAGNTVALDVRASFGDSVDLSETHTVTLSGLPTGATLSAGTHNADGSWTLAPDQLAGLALNIPGSVTGGFTIGVAATATENDGDVATATGAIDVTFTGAPAGDDVLSGGLGADRLYGGGGDDTLAFSGDAQWNSGWVAHNAGSPGAAGSGENVSIVGKDRSHDLFDGGAGTDTLAMGDGNGAVFLEDTYSPNGGAARLSSVEVIQAGAGDDVVDLTSSRFSYGDVTIDGGSGNDLLWGNAGDDLILGGTGNDMVDGGAGSDRVDAGAGNDTATFVAGQNVGERDVYDGGAGTDALRVMLTRSQFESPAFRQDLADFKSFLASHGDPNSVSGQGDVFHFQSIGLDARNFESLQVYVDGVPADLTASTPTLGTESAAGLEDTAIPLDIAAALTDTDGSETLSLTISGMPEGASLSAGTDNGDGTWTLTPAQLSGLTVTPPHDSNLDFRLTVTATSTEASTGERASATSSFTVDVKGVADTPTLNADVGVGVVQAGESSVTVTNMGSDAGYHNTYGYYVMDDQGHPIQGQIVWADVKTTVGQTFTLEDVDPDRVGFFLLSDGAGENSGLTNGQPVTFAQDTNGKWQVLNEAGQALRADVGGGLFFTNQALNADRVDHEKDSTAAGSQNWEDLKNGGDFDYNDANFNVATHEEAGETVFSLDISAGLTDTDGSETLAVLIGGLPEGASLSAGTDNGDGTWTLTPAQLGGLTLTVPETVRASFDLTVTATSTENDGDMASAMQVLTVPIAGDTEASAPVVAAANVSGNEDTPIALDLSAALMDTDGSETLAVTLSGLPEGASLSAGTDNGNGTWTVAAGDLANLKVTPPKDFHGQMALAITAVATEGGTGDQASATGTFLVNVAPVADTPVIEAANAGGYEDTSIALSISAEVPDSTETVAQVIVGGLPAGARLSAGVHNNDGTWTLQPADLANLRITPPEDYSGRFDMRVTALSTDGSRATETLAVNVEAVADNPDLAVTDVAGDAGEAIPLDIKAALTDLDGSETLSVTIAGLPDGASLSAGTDNGDGSWTLTAGDLSGLTLMVPGPEKVEFALGGSDFGSKSAMIDSWSQTIEGHDITVTAYDKNGRPGTIDGDVGRGIGVAGLGDTEIDAEGSGSESMVVDFDGMVIDSAHVGIRALFIEDIGHGRFGAETGHWEALLNGQPVGGGDFSAIAGSPDGRLNLDIQVDGGFDQLRFSAVGNHSDYLLENLKAETSGDSTAPSAFDLTVTATAVEPNGDLATTTATLAVDMGGDAGDGGLGLQVLNDVMLGNSAIVDGQQITLDNMVFHEGPGNSDGHAVVGTSNAPADDDAAADTSSGYTVTQQSHGNSGIAHDNHGNHNGA